MKMMKGLANDHYDDHQVMMVSPSTLSRGKHEKFISILSASQDSDYCTEDFNLLNETDVW